MWRTSPQQLLGYVVPLTLFASFIATIAMAPDRKDAALIAIATVFIGTAIYAARNVALAVIALVIPLARHAGLALEPQSAAKAGVRPKVRDEPPRAMLATCALVVAIVGGTFSNRLKTWQPVPTGAVAFMERGGLHGNVLNQYEWGPYLAWHLGEGSRVFIDGRCELVYSDKLIRQYAIFFYGIDGGNKVLDEYPHDYVLMGLHTKGADIVRKDPRWELMYEDDTAVLFKRSPLPLQPPTFGALVPHGTPADTYFP